MYCFVHSSAHAFPAGTKPRNACRVHEKAQKDVEVTRRILNATGPGLGGVTIFSRIAPLPPVGGGSQDCPKDTAELAAADVAPMCSTCRCWRSPSAPSRARSVRPTRKRPQGATTW